MIVLDKNSWFVKYWVRLGCTERGFIRLLEGYRKLTDDGDDEGHYWVDVPAGTNLCQLVRIVALYAPLKLLIFGTLAAVPLYMFFMALFTNPIGTFVFFLSFGAIIGFGIGIGWLITKTYFYISDNNVFSNSLPIQYYKAVKGKYCPRISFTGTSSDSTS